MVFVTNWWTLKLGYFWILLLPLARRQTRACRCLSRVMASFPLDIYPTVGCAPTCCVHSALFSSDPLQHLLSLVFFYYSHSCGGEVLPPRGFALQFSDEHFVTYLVATLTFYLEGDLVKCIALCKAGYLVRCCWGEGLVLLSLRGSGLWPAGSIHHCWAILRSCTMVEGCKKA